MAKAKPTPPSAEPVAVAELVEAAEVLAHSYDAESGILTVVLISGPKLRFAPGEVPAGLSDLTIPF